ncbi:NAD-dependent epimerase/dehydratase family protein, partial [Paraburkholderia sp. RL17-380-BIE-A]|uniref:NAD-dependent epimerase/dehydratase family protein n=1 Tax=Paraburkholderia sp. RL17-380-BIE-A TaxID=3031630 RepID=UPI0038B7F6C3
MSSFHAQQPIRTLVTGASGFTGRYLVDNLLGRGHTVIETVAGRNEPETPTRVRLDITSPDACRGAGEVAPPPHKGPLGGISGGGPK